MHLVLTGRGVFAWFCPVSAIPDAACGHISNHLPPSSTINCCQYQIQRIILFFIILVLQSHLQGMFSYTAVFWKAPFQGFPQHKLSMLQFIPHIIYLHWLGKEI